MKISSTFSRLTIVYKLQPLLELAYECMYVCMMQMECEILIPKYFPKGLFVIDSRHLITWSSFLHKIRLGHNDPKPDPKNLKVFETIVDQIAFTFFDHFLCFDHHFVKSSYSNILPLSYVLLPFRVCLCARVSHSYSFFYLGSPFFYVL